MTDFVKRSRGAPPGFFACEATGLAWLSEVAGGARCVSVRGYDDTSLTLERLYPARPTLQAAAEFGRRLALTHDAGAAGFGAPPDGWSGDGFFGPLSHPLSMSLTAYRSWGEFYARERLTPMLELAAADLGEDALEVLRQVISRCSRGDFDDDDAPARLHGDLWSGNVMWTPDGAVLVDPAAHGGHRLADLAMLGLFGCPHLETVYAGYLEVHWLPSFWRQRMALHQLYPLLAHVVLFGAGYLRPTIDAARAALEIR